MPTGHTAASPDTLFSICPGITIHDFRIVSDAGCKKIIFDAVVPFSAPISEKEVKNRFQRELSKIDSDYIAVIDIDRSDGR